MGDRECRPVASRIVEERYQLRCQQLHRERLAKIGASRSKIDNSAPFSAPHINPNNPKRREQKEAKQKEIDHENQVLIEKLLKIAHTDSSQIIKPHLARTTFRFQQGQYFDPVSHGRCVDHINPMVYYSAPSSPTAKSRSARSPARSRVSSARSTAAVEALGSTPGSPYLFAAHGLSYRSNLRPTTASPYSASCPTTPTRALRERPWSTPNAGLSRSHDGPLSAFSDPLASYSPPASPSSRAGSAARSRFHEHKACIEEQDDVFGAAGASARPSPAQQSASGSAPQPAFIPHPPASPSGAPGMRTHPASRLSVTSAGQVDIA